MKKQFTPEERDCSKPIGAFSPDGTVTFETCPVCLMPDVKVEHGKEVYIDADAGTIVREARKMKLWHCPECGDSLVIVAE